jgi:hypothetical protein
LGEGGEYGTATAGQVLAPYTIGTEMGVVAGTMVDRGAINQSLAINATYTIPVGYHNGSGKVTQVITTKGAQTYTPGTTDQTIVAGQYLSGDQIVKGDANHIAANIKNGVTDFGVTGTLKPKVDFSSFSFSLTNIVDYVDGEGYWCQHTTYSQANLYTSTGGLVKTLSMSTYGQIKGASSNELLVSGGVNYTILDHNGTFIKTINSNITTPGTEPISMAKAVSAYFYMCQTGGTGYIYKLDVNGVQGSNITTAANNASKIYSKEDKGFVMGVGTTAHFKLTTSLVSTPFNYDMFL